ncbi:MAG: polysaccharide pyruvyl transferase family protein, partial [Candidatus Absconditabacterales bacterium]
FIFSNYDVSKLYVEVGNKNWMEHWIEKNSQILNFSKYLNKLQIVENKQHRFKIITHLANFLGLGKYKKLFKFFGGGEVLTDERPFPHDGWNLPLLFNYSIKRGEFVLLGGIGKITKRRTNLLYKYLLPKAQSIITRDKISYEIVENEKGIMNNEQLKFYQDFSLETLKELKMNNEKLIIKNEKPRSCGTSLCSGIIEEEKIASSQRSFSQGQNYKKKSDYILINVNKKSCDQENLNKIKEFCQKYYNYKKIFFPCDINDDLLCYPNLKKIIPDLQLHNRTEKDLFESLNLFLSCKAGIGARLHFLLPLKIYDKPLIAIPYADKINKMIMN